jgi:DMSO/TMAO reductase YedYZ molybdopterin-dependent catalytic subunit
VKFWRPAAAAGLVGSAVVTGAMAIVHTAVPSVPFLPLALAQAVVKAAPGGLATYFIERLGHWAIRLAVVGTLVAFLASGAFLGLLLPALTAGSTGRRLAAGVLSFVPMWVLSVLIYPTPAESVGRGAFAALSLPIDLAGGAAASWTYARLSAAPATQATDLSRRYVLRAVWWGVLGVLVGAADLGRLLYRRPDPGSKTLVLPDLMRVLPPPEVPADRAFAQVAGLTPEVTSNESFYVVDEEIIDPDIDPDTWRLTVGGVVGRPFGLTYEELKRLPAVERFQTLECISNTIGGNLISTAKWVGVPMPLVLNRAGVRSNAVEVVLRAAGGYTESLSIEQAMDQSTLLAIGMNDRVLPRAHGFPVRVLSVGTYGMKNPKWLVGMEVVDRPYIGYWEQRGWSKPALVKTMSRIDVPRSGSQVRGTVTFAGVAFAGDRGISRVEVSTDGGRTWTPAELETALSPLTWRRWLLAWGSQRGGQSGVLVRAYDGQGLLQTPKHAAPHPDGASGYDAITVRDESG